MSPNRKEVADQVSEADKRAIEADPQAELERGRKRPETDPRHREQHEGDIVHEDIDPNEVDPGAKPRSPI